MAASPETAGAGNEELVFLFDVDNTLLDNDRVQDGLRNHLERELGAASRDRYWAIVESLASIFVSRWDLAIKDRVPAALRTSSAKAALDYRRRRISKPRDAPVRANPLAGKPATPAMPVDPGIRIDLRSDIR